MERRKPGSQWPRPVSLAPFCGQSDPTTYQFNTLDPVGIVAHNGRHVTLTGPVAITAGDRANMRVTVSERAASAGAEG